MTIVPLKTFHECLTALSAERPDLIPADCVERLYSIYLRRKESVLTIAKPVCFRIAVPLGDPCGCLPQPGSATAPAIALYISGGSAFVTADRASDLKHMELHVAPFAPDSPDLVRDMKIVCEECDERLSQRGCDALSLAKLAQIASLLRQARATTSARYISIFSANNFAIFA